MAHFINKLIPPRLPLRNRVNLAVSWVAVAIAFIVLLLSPLTSPAELIIRIIVLLFVVYVAIWMWRLVRGIG